MVVIDTRNCCFEATINGTLYEMGIGGIHGNYFFIDKVIAGVTIFNIKNDILSIVQFNIIDEGKGYGRIFYELLRDYAKNTYGCKKAYAKSLTGKGNGFFEHMGLTNDDGKKCPEMRWGNI